MDINWVIWIVYGVCLNTKRCTGHSVQTVRSHKSIAERKYVFFTELTCIRCSFDIFHEQQCRICLQLTLWYRWVHPNSFFQVFQWVCLHSEKRWGKPLKKEEEVLYVDNLLCIFISVVGNNLSQWVYVADCRYMYVDKIKRIK